MNLILGSALTSYVPLEIKLIFLHLSCFSVGRWVFTPNENACEEVENYKALRKMLLILYKHTFL